MTDTANTTKKSSSGEKVFVTELGANDVLVGRGAPSNAHSGNKRFRALVCDRKQEYLSTARRPMKNQIAREIVDIILRQRGGRFLRKIESLVEAEEMGVQPGLTAWALVAEEVAVQKTKQALRERDTNKSTDSKSSLRSTPPNVPRKTEAPPTPASNAPATMTNIQTTAAPAAHMLSMQSGARSAPASVLSSSGLGLPAAALQVLPPVLPGSMTTAQIEDALFAIRQARRAAALDVLLATRGAGLTPEQQLLAASQSLPLPGSLGLGLPSTSSSLLNLAPQAYPGLQLQQHSFLQHQTLGADSALADTLMARGPAASYGQLQKIAREAPRQPVSPLSVPAPTTTMTSRSASPASASSLPPKKRMAALKASSAGVEPPTKRFRSAAPATQSG